MRSLNRVTGSLGGREECQRRILGQLPVSPQDDHVIEFARQFGWNPEWMDKVTKKRGNKQLQQEAATRVSGGIGEMLTTQVAQSHVPSSHESQVVSREDRPQVSK